jgi:hypothetical protein
VAIFGYFIIHPFISIAIIGVIRPCISLVCFPIILSIHGEEIKVTQSGREILSGKIYEYYYDRAVTIIFMNGSRGGPFQFGYASFNGHRIILRHAFSGRAGDLCGYLSKIGIRERHALSSRIFHYLFPN